MLNPEKQFILEVERSMPRILELEQYSPNDPWTVKYTPVLTFLAVFPPSPLEIENCLALKLPLEEWRHLLEGSTVPFLVWTDHRKPGIPKHGQTPQPLDRLAGPCFLIDSISPCLYRPGSRNVKPDALSHLHHSPADVEND